MGRLPVKGVLLLSVTLQLQSSVILTCPSFCTAGQRPAVSAAGVGRDEGFVRVPTAPGTEADLGVGGGGGEH